MLAAISLMFIPWFEYREGREESFFPAKRTQLDATPALDEVRRLVRVAADDVRHAYPAAVVDENERSVGDTSIMARGEWRVVTIDVALLDRAGAWRYRLAIRIGPSHWRASDLVSLSTRLGRDVQAKRSLADRVMNRPGRGGGILRRLEQLRDEVLGLSR